MAKFGILKLLIAGTILSSMLAGVGCQAPQKAEPMALTGQTEPKQDAEPRAVKHSESRRNWGKMRR